MPVRTNQTRPTNGNRKLVKPSVTPVTTPSMAKTASALNWKFNASTACLRTAGFSLPAVATISAGPTKKVGYPSQWAIVPRPRPWLSYRLIGAGRVKAAGDVRRDGARHQSVEGAVQLGPGAGFERQFQPGVELNTLDPAVGVHLLQDLDRSVPLKWRHQQL